MKNIFLGLLTIVTFGLMTSSCTDFLEEKPKTNLTTNVYFTSLSQAEAMVGRLYRQGVPRYYHDKSVFSGMEIMFGPFISGLYDNQDYKGQEAWIGWMQTLNHNSRNINSQMNDLWDQAYRYGIARANLLIKYVPDMDIAEDDKNRVLGQAKFFRALSYLHLVRYFGDVPLVLEPTETLDNMYIERTPSEQVYAQIIEDATFAAEVLNNTNFTDNGFRITRAAAETVLANAYLQMSGYPLQKDNYKNAADAARSIINAGKHELIQHVDGGLQSAYNALRTEDYSKEYIYSKEYESLEDKDDNNNHNGALPQHSLPNMMLDYLPKGFNRTILVNVYKPSNIILNAFDKEDLRVQEQQYWWNEYTFINKDDEVQTVRFNQTCPWRFYNEKALFETTMGDKDVPIFRYAEVLLIAAEAIAQSEGVTSEAVGYLAEVRGRAYEYPGSTTTREDIVRQLSGLTTQQFIEEVWTERLRELVFEFKVWDDIQRTRKYPKVSETNPGKVEWINVIGATNPFGATYQEHHLLWPISDDEIQRNPSLTQNPGF